MRNAIRIIGQMMSVIAMNKLTKLRVKKEYGVWYYTKKIHNNLSSYNLYNYNMQPIITFYNYTDMKQFCMNGAKYEK